MDNQHKHIQGYRDLTPDEIKAMNDIKSIAASVGVLVHAMKQDPALDQRWVSIGATELQQGFMCLTRAVAKPTTF